MYSNTSTVYVCPRSYWKGMYNRFETTVHERENITDVLSALVDHNASLDDHINLLEKVGSRANAEHLRRIVKSRNNRQQYT